MKPRRKQHQGYNHKTGHNVPNRVKDILPPNNLQENEVIGGAGGSIEGKLSLSNRDFRLLIEPILMVLMSKPI